MPSARTIRAITPTTIPAMAPPERPLLGLGFCTAVEVAVTGPRDVVLVVLGPGDADVDMLPLDEGVRVEDDTTVVINGPEAAAAEALSYV